MTLAPAWPTPMPRRLLPQRRPELPRGIKHPGEWLENLRLDLDLKPREVEERTAAFGEPYRVDRTYLSRIESGEREPARVGGKKLEALRAVYRIPRDEFERRTGVSIPRGAHLDAADGASDAQRAAQNRALEEARAEAAPWSTSPVYSTGAGRKYSEDEDPVGVDLTLEELERRFPNVLRVRVEGDCLEPLIHEGATVYVVPEPALAAAGHPVLVWFAGNGRKLGFLFEPRPDGDHVLIQTNPMAGEKRVVVAPVGSTIIGPVVRIVEPDVPALRAREMYETVMREAPAVLGTPSDD